MAKILIIGGGAAGMAAAIFLGRENQEVHVFEKNEKLGKKLFITGKGRCNVLNACDKDTFFQSVVSNPKFLYSAYDGFESQRAADFFEALGVRLKTERGNRMFPASDHSSDVIRAMEREMNKLGVKIHLGSRVQKILIQEAQEGEKKACGVLLENGKEIRGDKILLATGGLSYPATGSTGEGHRFAEEVGHTLQEARPALVPIEIKEDYVTSMQGLSLKNVRFTIKDGKKELYDGFGELLFTHFGISGPLALTASSYIGKKLQEKELQGVLDLKASRSLDQLEARLLREFEAGRNKQFKNLITGWFPAKLYPVILSLGGISPEKKANEITKKERQQFLHLLKHFPLTLTGLRGFEEAIITQGGVKVKAVSPKTMESKLVKDLYFAGEVLDLDAVTGGFNLQIAWSTANAAANGMLS